MADAASIARVEAIPNDELVRRVVDGKLERWAQLGLMRTPHRGLPVEMVVEGSGPDADGYVEWRAVPSTVTDAELDALEAEIGHAYPPIHRCLLKHVHYLVIHVFEIALEEHLPGGWGEHLADLYRNAYLPERIVGSGLIPFGSDDRGLFCVDTRHARADGDAPVVLWDHEWVETGREIQPVFSSARKMLECALVALEEVDLSHATDPPAKERRRAAIGRVLAQDPDGAGGEAWPFWRMWSRDTVPPLDVAMAARVLPALERELRVDLDNEPTRDHVSWWLDQMAEAEELLGRPDEARTLRERARRGGYGG